MGSTIQNETNLGIVENLFRFQISNYNFSPPLPPWYLSCIYARRTIFTDQQITSKNSNHGIEDWHRHFRVLFLFLFYGVVFSFFFFGDFFHANYYPFVWKFSKFRRFDLRKMLWLIVFFYGVWTPISFFRRRFFLRDDEG